MTVFMTVAYGPLKKDVEYTLIEKGRDYYKIRAQGRAIHVPKDFAYVRRG